MALPSTRFRALRSYEADPHYANSQFGELRTTTRTQIIEISPTYPLSSLRNVVIAGNGGVVDQVASEYRVRTTSNADSSAILNSAEQGRYMPGFSAQVGVGVRIPTAPTGNQMAYWGYADFDNGFAWGVDATSVFCAIRRGGQTTKIRQQNWSADKLDGTGASGFALDLKSGNIFHIEFSWYGYGTIEWKATIVDEEGRPQTVTVHRWTPDEEQSITNPNLPIAVGVVNRENQALAGTATPFEVFVGGRQFSIIGDYNPSERLTSLAVLNKSLTTTPVAMATIRQRSGFPALPSRIEGFGVTCDTSALLTIHAGATLGGTADFKQIPGLPSAETCLEMDEAMTTITGGILLYTALIPGVSGAFISKDIVNAGFSLMVPSHLPVTFALRTITGTGTASMAIRIIESW